VAFDVQRSPLAVIFLTITVDLIGFGIIIPLLPLYADSFGASGVAIGWLMAAYSLMQFLFAPLWGRLSDRVGRRPVLLLSIGGNAIALLFMGLAVDYWWLLASRIVAGLFTANVAVANAYIADITPPEARARGMGIVGAAFGLGIVIGPFIGGEVSTLGYWAPPFVAAGLATANLVSALVLLPESSSPELRRVAASSGLADQIRRVVRIDGVVAIVVLGFVQIFAFSMLEMAFVLFAKARLGFDVREAGRVFAFIGILMVAVQGGVIGPVVRRFGEARVVFAGLASTALGMALLPATPANGWILMLGFMSLVAIGHGLTNPALAGLLSVRAPPELQGMCIGVSRSFGALARVAGPPVAGVLFDGAGAGLPISVGGLVTAAACALAAVALAGERPPRCSTPSSEEATR
jgi:MFS family permease